MARELFKEYRDPNETLKAMIRQLNYIFNNLDTSSNVNITSVPLHTQLAATITDLQSAVSGNSNVTANTTARHTHSNKALLDNINSWGIWTPTLTWSTGTPASITKIARFAAIGKTLFFNINISSADGNGATDLTISLPVPPANNSTINRFIGTQMVDNVYSDDVGFYCQNGTATICMLSPQICTDNKACAFYINGFYEIA